MYLEFYGLKEPPFSITPDPRFVYLSERHRDALAHLLYGIGQGGGGGFVQLTGEVGTGKTTLSRLLLEQLPDNTQVALILNPHLSPIELLETIGEELHLDLAGRRGSLKRLLDVLNAHLLKAYAEGQRVVLIIDEAQELSRLALEQVRLLTNLETPSQKLLQIVLLGQPELRDLLERPELRQLSQRVTARYHLTPLTREETEVYVRHRLAVAGATRFPFTKLALRRLHERSGGVPRLINVIADRALLAGFAHDQAQIGERLVERAAGEALSTRIRRYSPPPALLVGALAVALAALLLWLLPGRDPPLAAPQPVQPVTDVVPARSAVATAPESLDQAALAERIRATGPSLLLAFNRMLALWSVRAEAIDAATASRCPAVLSSGVFCLRGNANLSKLARLGRPAIVHLHGEGTDAWALLLGVDALRVRLWLGGERVELDRLLLERQWNGEFISIWRAPEFVVLPLRQGDSGAAVDWLRTQVQADGDQGAIGPALFDAELMLAVKRTQARYGLLPDGVVGQETLLALIANDDSGPQLRTRLD
ncbi:MAG: AAA family ATPase [Xanthomonadaceae bacterium]|nr:AAA family ATPase [Xanthomonadaceae bacterium]MDP2186078.1 AAA family ATPase [Xanthomonadales bacterium]MDZ4117473.1 AAA family ATPase [Xanthomonadaceae bacterium]MDZ4379455.1 AAA family ATPase [Xanthomonadaceae bacterium]